MTIANNQYPAWAMERTCPPQFSAIDVVLCSCHSNLPSSLPGNHNQVPRFHLNTIPDFHLPTTTHTLAVAHSTCDIASPIIESEVRRRWPVALMLSPIGQLPLY